MHRRVRRGRRAGIFGGFGEADGEDDGEVCGSNFFRMGGDDAQKSGTIFRAHADVSAAAFAVTHNPIYTRTPYSLLAKSPAILAWLYAENITGKLEELLDRSDAKYRPLVFKGVPTMVWRTGQT